MCTRLHSKYKYLINACDIWSLHAFNRTPEIDVYLTHWGRVTHICVGKLTIIGSDNGLSPGRRQAIIWNNAGILSIGPLGTKGSEIFIEILTFSFKKMRLKVSSAKWRPFCLGLNVLTTLIHWASLHLTAPSIYKCEISAFGTLRLRAFDSVLKSYCWINTFECFESLCTWLGY